MYNLVTRAKVKGIAMFTRKRIYKCNEMITVQLIVDLEIRMDKWSKKVAVVTGASSGIGSTIASKLVEHGVIVIGLARRVDRIQTLAKSLESETGTLVAMQCDVTNEKDVKSVFQTIDQHYGPISILINNAGVARNANLMEGPLEKLREVVETNLMGVVTCTICALESMKQVASPGEKPFGHIVNINSVLGHFIPQLPFLNIYPATKFGITAYTEILRQELRNAATNIRVTVSILIIRIRIYSTLKLKNYFIIFH